MTLAKCGAVEDAYQISASMSHRTVFSWTAMLSAKVDMGHSKEALEMFQAMQKEGIEPNNYTFVTLFKACGSMRNLSRGKELHEVVTKRGLSGDSFVCSALISFYSKCGSLAAAEDAFSSCQVDIVSWNAMITAYLENGASTKALKLYRQLQEEGVRPDQLTYVLILQACGDLTEKDISLFEGHARKQQILQIGRAIHSDSSRSDRSLFLSNALINMYGKCGSTLEAEHVFGALSCRSIVSWNSMLAAYLHEGNCKNVLLLYKQMQEEGICPSDHTFVFTIQACGNLAEGEVSLTGEGEPIIDALCIGEALQIDAQRYNFVSNTFVGTALICMYGKCGAITKAESIFVVLPYRDKIAWNAMLSMYIEHTCGMKALKLFRQMHEEDLMIDQVGFVLALQACTLVLDKEIIMAVGVKINRVQLLEITESLHADARKKGFSSDTHLASSLIIMYAKVGAILNAENVFVQLSHCDVVLWSTLISAYVEQDEGGIALQLFQQMLKKGIPMDPHVLVYALQACCSLVTKESDVALPVTSKESMALEIGKILHEEALSNGFISNPHVCIALLSMYGKCGAFDEAEEVFSIMPHDNTVLWNAMFSSYIEHGHFQKVLSLYTKMFDKKLAIDDVTLVCVLQACQLSGHFQICTHIHFIGSAVGWEQLLSVAASLIHVYGSCASIHTTRTLVDALPRPDLVSWNACCDGHTTVGDILGSLYVFENFLLSGIEPDDVTFISVLSVCSHTGCTSEGLEYFESMAREYRIGSGIKHLGILFDLLGRAGDFNRIEDLLRRTTSRINFPMWLSLLGSCSTHGNVELARRSFEHAVQLRPWDSTPYIVMSNIYVDAGLYDNAAKVERLRQDFGASDVSMGDIWM
ncbi:hypothetical protein KP509_16G006400 [Ceratopteris richardii]|nr:hypothetical protein KP509_16G006400 [Ceratopteris richardii]